MTHLATRRRPARWIAAIARRRAARTAVRPGITLLEVMISMFITLVGILSVFSLVTLGRYEMLEGSKADRAMAVARSAQREMLIRGYLRPLQTDQSSTVAPNGYLPMWLLADGATNAWTPTGAAPWPIWAPGGTTTQMASVGTWTAGSPPVMPFDSMSGAIVTGAFAFDPIGVAANGTTALFFPPCFQNTPISNTGVGTVPPAVAPGNSTYLPMTRITVRAAPFYNTVSKFVGITAQEADAVFRSQDDLQINPLVSDQPPTQAFNMYTPASMSIPARRLSSGEYSWLATIMPTAEDTRSCIVSVVVFYKRNANLPAAPSATIAPPERMVTLNVGTLSTSSPPAFAANSSATAMTGGGDVMLTTPSTITADYTKVRANQWILVSQVNTAATPASGWWRWYRVAATSDAIKDSSGNWQRPVKLEGLDWTWLPGVPVYASIFDDVIGVYERAMQLEESGALMSPN